MDLQWLAEIGTNDWIKGFWENNWILITIGSAPIAAWLKGKHPEFWSKLSTMIPFVGDPKKRL